MASFRTTNLRVNGFFAYWEQKVFREYNGLIEQINNFYDQKYFQKNDDFREVLELKIFKNFFYLLILGLILAFLVYLIEFAIIKFLKI